MLSLLALGAQRSLLNRGAGQITLAEWHASSSRVSELATLEIGLFVLTGGFSERELRDAGAVAVFDSLVSLRERLDDTPLVRA